MKEHLHSAHRKLFMILLISSVLGGCNTYKQVACPELKLPENKHGKYQANARSGIFDRTAYPRHNHRNYNTRIGDKHKPVMIVSTENLFAGTELYYSDLQGNNYYEDQLTGGMSFSPESDAPAVNVFQNSIMPVMPISTDSRSPEIIFIKNESWHESQFETFNGNDVQRRRKNVLKSQVPSSSYPEGSIMLFAVTSFVLGIIGIFTMPLLVGIIATVFGAVALNMGRRHGIRDYRRLAIAGLILGIIEIVAGIILLPFAILGLFF